MENDAAIYPMYASHCETVSLLILKISGAMFARFSRITMRTLTVKKL